MNLTTHSVDFEASRDRKQVTSGGDDVSSAVATASDGDVAVDAMADSADTADTDVVRDSPRAASMDAGSWLSSRVEPEGACSDDSVNGDNVVRTADLLITQPRCDDDDDDDDDGSCKVDALMHPAQSAVVVVPADTTTTTNEQLNAGELQSPDNDDSDDEHSMTVVVPLPKRKHHPVPHVTDTEVHTSTSQEVVTERHSPVDNDMSTSQEIVTERHSFVDNDVSTSQEVVTERHSPVDNDVSTSQEIATERHSFVDNDVSTSQEVVTERHSLVDNDVSTSQEVVTERHSPVDNDVSECDEESTVRVALLPGQELDDIDDEVDVTSRTDYVNGDVMKQRADDTATQRVNGGLDVDNDDVVVPLPRRRHDVFESPSSSPSSADTSFAAQSSSLVIDTNTVIDASYTPRTVQQTVADTSTVACSTSSAAVAYTSSPVADNITVVQVTTDSALDTLADSDTDSIADSDSDKVTVVEVTTTVTDPVADSVTVVQDTPSVADSVSDPVLADSVADSDSDKVTVVEVTTTVTDPVADSVTVVQDTPSVADSVSDPVPVVEATETISDSVADSVSDNVTVVQVRDSEVDSVADSDNVSVMSATATDDVPLAQDSPTVAEITADLVSDTITVIQDTDSASDTVSVAEDTTSVGDLVADSEEDKLTVRQAGGTETSCLSDGESSSVVVDQLQRSAVIARNTDKETSVDTKRDAVTTDDEEKQHHDVIDQSDSVTAAADEVTCQVTASDDDSAGDVEHVRRRDVNDTSQAGDVALNAAASNDDTNSQTSCNKDPQDIMTSGIYTGNDTPEISTGNSEVETQGDVDDVRSDAVLVTTSAPSDVRTPTEDQHSSCDWTSTTDEPSVSVPLPMRKDVEHAVCIDHSVNGHYDDDRPITDHSSTDRLSANTADVMTIVNGEQNDRVDHDASSQNAAISDSTQNKQTELESPPADGSESKLRQNVEPETVEHKESGETGRHAMLIRQNFEQSTLSLSDQQQQPAMSTQVSADESQQMKLAHDNVAVDVTSCDDIRVDSVIGDNHSTVTTDSRASVKHGDVDADALPATTQPVLTTERQLITEQSACSDVSQQHSAKPMSAPRQEQAHAPNDRRRQSEDTDSDSLYEHRRGGAVQFARASELARRFERLSEAAASTTTSKSTAVRRNTSAPSSTHLPDKSVALTTTTTVTTPGKTVTTADSAVTTVTTSDKADTKDEHWDGPQRSATSAVKAVNEQKSTASSVDQTDRQPVERSTSITRRQTQAVSTGRGLQFVQSAKSVVLLAQTSSRKASDDTAENSENRRTERKFSDGGTSRRNYSASDVEQQQDTVSDIKLCTNNNRPDISSTTDTLERPDADYKASRMTTTADGGDDELSRVRANLRSNVRPTSTSRHFTGAATKNTTRY